METEYQKPQMKGSEDSKGEEETCVFTRPSGLASETCIFTHPSGKESEAEVSDSSLASTASTASGTQARKRRQPSLCKPEKAKKLAVKDADVQDPYETAPITRAKKDLPTAEKIQQELKNCTSVDIKAKIIESMSTVERVADSSRNLRGVHAQSLRMAARSALAAAFELAQRFSTSGCEELKRENEELRVELTNLKAQLASLTADISSLRQKDAKTDGRTKQGEEAKVRKDPQKHHIVALVEQKLAEFRAEMFPEQAAKPSSEKEVPDAKKKKGKKIKKRQEKAVHPPQLVVSEAPSNPPRRVEPEQTPTESWAKVTARNAKTVSSANRTHKNGTLGRITTSGNLNKTVKPAPAPKTAAVTITLSESATVSYAIAMATAKQRVNLSDCGISQVRQKKAITGGLVLEVPGPDSAKKADALAERLRVALAGMGIRIARPVKTGELRVMDLDESITEQDLATAIAQAGGCSSEEVKVVEIRFNTSRLGTVWVRCPLVAVRKLAEEKHVQVGWARARVRVLAARQLQCFRCLEKGHVRKQCSNPVDRSLCCYCCGVQGHKARECKAQAPKCPVCADLGRPADHRLGGKKCNPPKKKTGKGGQNLKPPESCSSSETATPAHLPAEEAMEAQNSRS